MDERLQRLIDLWSASLEGRLEAAGQAELDGLMADGPLLEAFTDWQAQRSPQEGQPYGGTPGLDQRVRNQFLLRVRLKRWVPWMGAGLLGLGALALLNGWGDSQARAIGVTEGAGPDPVVEATAVPTPAPRHALGLPPGFGRRPSRVILHQGQPVELQVSLATAGPLQVDVWDAAGQHIRTLAIGVAGAGGHAQAWDGTGDRGQALPAGLYRLVASDGQRVLTQKLVELRPGP